MSATTKKKARKRAGSGRPEPGRRHTTTVAGPAEHPDRVLTIDFDRFLVALAGVPEPPGADLDSLASGADLLLGVMDGATYGYEYPGAAPTALAERILDITDEAFDYAHRILEQDAYNTAYFATEEDRTSARRMETNLRLLDYRDDEDLFNAICRQLLSCDGAEDPSAAGELL